MRTSCLLMALLPEAVFFCWSHQILETSTYHVGTPVDARLVIQMYRQDSHRRRPPIIFWFESRISLLDTQPLKYTKYQTERETRLFSWPAKHRDGGLRPCSPTGGCSTGFSMIWSSTLGYLHANHRSHWILAYTTEDLLVNTNLISSLLDWRPPASSILLWLQLNIKW